MAKVLFDEDFLVKKCRSIRIDSLLPLRLQKRQLLNKLGFPENPNLSVCPVNQVDKLDQFFSEFMKNPPFLIITSEKPMKTLIPPLFVVKNNKRIIYRDNCKREKEVSAEEVMPIISSYPSESWVEFTKPLWKGEIIAGRILYIDSTKQILEVQQGVEPAHLGDYRGKPYFSCELEFFGCQLSFIDFYSPTRRFKRKGYRSYLNLSEIQEICRKLASLADSFETLRKIAPLPTLEFAWSERKGLITIDIDWPDQYLIREVRK